MVLTYRAAAPCLGLAGKAETLSSLPAWEKPSREIFWPQHCTGGSSSGRTSWQFFQQHASC